MDADIMIQLKEKHRPTAMYEDRIRRDLTREFPGVTTYFEAADIIAQVLNFGLSSAIDVQVSGNDLNSGTDSSHPWLTISKAQSVLSSLHPGDKILFGKYSGTEVKMDGEELVVMREEDVMAVVEGK